jgi:hypothetical protein
MIMLCGLMYLRRYGLCEYETMFVHYSIINLEEEIQIAEFSDLFFQWFKSQCDQSFIYSNLRFFT